MVADVAVLLGLEKVPTVAAMEVAAAAAARLSASAMVLIVLLIRIVGEAVLPPPLEAPPTVAVQAPALAMIQLARALDKLQ
jgi:hypothetical protein